MNRKLIFSFYTHMEHYRDKNGKLMRKGCPAKCVSVGLCMRNDPTSAASLLILMDADSGLWDYWQGQIRTELSVSESLSRQKHVEKRLCSYSRCQKG